MGAELKSGEYLKGVCLRLSLLPAIFVFLLTLSILHSHHTFMNTCARNPHVLSLADLLLLHLQRNVIKTTWGVLDPPVGNTRLNVVRLVASLLQSNTHSINSELINLNTLGVILVSPQKHVLA